MGTFFGDLYLRSTLPFLDPRVTRLEADFIGDALQLVAGERVLDLCCGHGRHLELLRLRGFRAVGLELDTASLAEMSPLGRTAAVQGDMRHLPFRAGFDALFAWYASLFLSENDAQNRAALQQAASVLRPGGRMLIHSHNPLSQRREPSSHFETRLPDGSSVVEDTRFDERTGMLTGHRKRHVAGAIQEGDFQVRCPRLEDHHAWSEDLGLILESSWGDIQAAPISETAPDLIVLLRRP